MMTYTKKRKRTLAFTLAELTVVIALFGIFSTTALSALNITLKYWSRVSNQVEMNAMCRMVISTISKEMRQAMPDRAPSRAVYAKDRNGNATTQLTPIHAPSRIGETLDYITLAEANPNTFDPALSGWNEQGTDKYRIITYKIDQNNQLVREVTSFDSASQSHMVSAITAAADNVILRITCKSAAVYEVKVTCQRFLGSQTYEATLTTDVIVLGT